MTAPRLAWALCCVALALVLTGPASLVISRDQAWIFSLSFGAVQVSTAVVGAVVASRLPRNAIGWILLGMGVGLGVSASGTAYGSLGILTTRGPLPLDEWAVWIGEWLFVPVVYGGVAALLLLFPDGRFLSRRWRVLGIASAVIVACATAVDAFVPGPMEDVDAIDNPAGATGWLADAITSVQGVVDVLALPVFGCAIAALVVRFRRSTGTERQQLKWISVSLVFVGVSLGLTAGAPVLGEATFFLALFSLAVMPVATGVAMLRYRLYDIDVVINKSVVLVVLVGFITAVYAVIVVGLGSLLPVGDGNLGLAIVATALVAVVFEPVRLRVQHGANRLVYGRRASPYETLAAMTEKIGDSVDPGDALGEAARLLAEGTGAAQAVVWVARDGVLTARATAGDDGGDPVPVALDGGELPTLVGVALVEPVRHEGKLVGALSLAKRPGEGVNSTDRRLVAELAGQAALLLANTRLRSRLGERLVELRISRQRMITAQDRARHALERDLHDGAQQELVALKVKLGLARTIATREGVPAVAQELDDTAQIADRAVDTLRDVARGIYPPLLESEGLAAALSAQARRAGLSVTVLDRAQIRYPRELEATAYFCALEALRNAVKHANATHAHVELNGTAADLVVTVTDDGNGFDPDTVTHGDGLTHMADRVDATGGTLSIDSTPGHGTTITLNLPTQETAAAAANPAPQLAGART